MAQTTETPQVGHLQLADLAAVLRAGWRGFCRAPQFGLFFSAGYVLGGFSCCGWGQGM